jgi:hypothetical protein
MADEVRIPFNIVTLIVGVQAILINQVQLRLLLLSLFDLR